MTPEQAEALDIARQLAIAGIPVFVAAPDETKPTGFALPSGWQQTTPDAAVVDRWREGMALAAVMGHGLDLLDVDPRGGGDLGELGVPVPVSYGAAVTPSGGMHSFIRSLGVRSRDRVRPGVDVKAGDEHGEGRGFAFVAPTVRTSKTTGEPAAYRWVVPPDLDRFRGTADDVSGSELAALVHSMRAGSTGPVGVEDFMRTGPWADILATLAGGRNNGVARLAAALRGRGGWRLDDAVEYMYARVWPLVDQTQGGHEFTADEFEATVRAAWRQYPDGQEQRDTQAATPPDPQMPAANPARYFGTTGGLLAATLAGDVAALGPLAEGVDDRMWTYHRGVWHSAKHVVRDRASLLMGERYRDGHAHTAESIVRSRVQTVRCDPVPELINFTNGLLDWRTGELRPHTPEVLSTVQLATDYDPDAHCPAFEKFLGEVLPPDMVETAWELVGYLMYSGNPLHKAVMLTGTGRNGKGTFLRVMVRLLGFANITTVSLHDLVNTRFSTASLFGKLANIAGDIDAGYLENTATLKGITGGDVISAEHKGRDRFDFSPWAVPVFSANKIPASADTTIGYLSRWLIVNFPHDFSGREDRFLDARLHDPDEVRGIAARGIAALPRLLDRGDFELTESGRQAREEFEQRVDQVRTWLADCVEFGGDDFMPRTPLYEAYKRWAARDGHKPVRASEFYDRVETSGGQSVKIRGIRGFRGLKVVDHGWSSLELPPSTKPTVTSENAKSGAGGADSPQPPTCARTHGGVRQNPPHRPHPAPTPDEPAPAAAPPEPKPKRARAKVSKAEAKAAKREAELAAAAGYPVALPVVLNRDTGVLRSVTLAGADALLGTVVRSGQAVTVDVETTGYPIGHADYALRTIQLGRAEFAVVLDATDAEQTSLAGRVLADAATLHAHSATADLGPLVHADLVDAESAWARMHDTVIAAKLADPSSTGSDAAGLKDLAADVLGERATAPAADAARTELFKAGRWLTDTKIETPVERSGWAQVDHATETMARYDASDVLDTAALAEVLPWPEPALLDRERTVQRMTARVTHRGVRIDGDRVRELLAEHTAAQAEAAERVRAFGVENPGSDRQVAAALHERGVELPRTPPSLRHREGQPSVAAGVLEPLRGSGGHVGELIAAILDYRHYSTALSLFLGPYRQLVERGDGRARPTVYTLGTDTGRMSCTRPNLQQLPREGGIRSCITADPGQLLIGADYSGVELRVAAALSGDPQLRQMIADGIDLHTEIARQVFGPDATKAHRYMVKRGVFGRIYGGGVPTLAKQVGCTEDVAAAMVATLDAMTPQLAYWSAQLRDAVKAGFRQFTTYSGRIIHLPPAYPHKAPNYAIQGTARELLVDALLRWQATRWGEATLWPVHDELDLLVPEPDAERATEVLVEVMTTELYGVPIVADPSTPSFAWRDAA